jgi:uncharacterized membrane protein
MKKTLWILFILSIFILIFNINLFNKIEPIIEFKEIEGKVIIGNSTGFNLDNKTLNFGKITPGTTASRQIEVINIYGTDIVLRIYGKGDMKEFVNFAEIKLKKDEKKKFDISISIPKDAKFGKYSGNIAIETRKR